MKMDDKTLTALQESIKNWQKNLKIAKKGSIFDFKIGANHCPLCELFIYGQPVENKCNNCPIKEKTGNSSCYGTSYYEVLKNLHDAMYAPNEDFAEKLKNLRCSTKREIDFLKSLLPAKEEDHE
jgi:hypothetical protein